MATSGSVGAARRAGAGRPRAHRRRRRGGGRRGGGARSSRAEHRSEPDRGPAAATHGSPGRRRVRQRPLADTLLVRDPSTRHRRSGDRPPRAARRRTRGAAAAGVAPGGYSGALRLLLAIDAQGRLIGVRVLEHRETPGLGDFVEERRTDWIRQFRPAVARLATARPLAGAQGRRRLRPVHGATITSRAVTRAVRDALNYVARHHAELFALSSPVAP